jgi:hypothetical protein
MMKNSSKLPIEISDYLKFLNKASGVTDKLVTKERVTVNLEGFGNAINQWLAYPDLFVDTIKAQENFNLFFYQRIILRMMNRHRQSYNTFTRGLSKSFLAFLSRYITTMLTPRHKAFVVAGTKKQAANIAREKIVDDLWEKFPLLKNDLIKVRDEETGRMEKPFVMGSDYAEFRFIHGGRLDVIGSGSSIRGGRRHSGIFEEVIEHDATEINERVLPLMNAERRNGAGNINPNEPHAAKLFVTTSGFQGTFAYDKVIETLCFSVLDPENYMVLGGDWRLPVMHGLLSRQTILEVLSSPTFEQDSFDREYGSIWSGSPKGAAFSIHTVTKARKVVRAHLKADNFEKGSEDFYVIAADMAKDGGANTAVTVLQVSPREYTFLFKQVNAFQIDSADYQVASSKLKHAIVDYKSELLIYDANGIGAALRDWLNKEHRSTETGELLPAYGIINPPSEKVSKELRRTTQDMEICYEIKAGGAVANDINRTFFAKTTSGHVKLLIKSSKALMKFKEHKNFLESTNAQMKTKLRPYYMTDILEEEMKNLDVVDVSDNVNKGLKVVRRNEKIQKDFFSAISYGVYGVHVYLELPYYNKKRKKTVSIGKFIMGDSHKKMMKRNVPKSRINRR